ncbi:MAG: hypothetical protein V7634_3675 [Bradyrhizobium sp.]
MSCSQWFWRRSRRVTLTLLAPALVGVLAASDAVQADGSVTFGYDQTGRVSSAAYDNGLCVVYAYDQAGNRTAQSFATSSASAWPGPDRLDAPCFRRCRRSGLWL